MSAEHSFYPLRSITSSHMQKLGRALWNWQLCGECSSKSVCASSTCPWSRAERLKSFWELHRNVSGAYFPDFLAQKPALESQDQLLQLICEIKSHQAKPRADLLNTVFNNNPTTPDQGSTLADQNQAFNIGASILLLMNCGTWRDSGIIREEYVPPIPWRDELAVKDFLNEAFPKTAHPYFDHKYEGSKMRRVKAGLTAVMLRKKAGLRLEATSDLRSHLTMELKEGVVRVYDCTAALKEILIATSIDSEACVIPRALALEVLDTIHNILFPSDNRCFGLLSLLVRKHGFDEDMLRYEHARYRRKDDGEVTYEYFGGRLAEIYDETQDPTPRRGWESWFQKYSAQRYMLMATMIGVFIAVLLGTVTLGVSTFQAWVSWQQWKHPVNQG